jgi:uncharacterized protein YhhL (DUF1145 family)
MFICTANATWNLKYQAYMVIVLSHIVEVLFLNELIKSKSTLQHIDWWILQVSILGVFPEFIFSGEESHVGRAN